jgi:hypothetical protein
MNDIPLVQIIHGFKNLSDGLRCIFLCKSALVAYSVEELASYSQLSHNVVFVLQTLVYFQLRSSSGWSRAFDSNQSTNWTMCGWCSF